MKLPPNIDEISTKKERDNAKIDFINGANRADGEADPKAPRKYKTLPICFNRYETERITKAAELCNRTFTDYIRTMAVECANREILKSIEEK